MVRKSAKRIVRLKYAAEDESVRSTKGPNALGAGEPQKEVERVSIPEGGEIHLQNSNILPDSLQVTNIKSGAEFSEVEDQNLKPGHFFFLAEDSTLFFSPEDAGNRVQIEYLWKEESAEEDEEDEESDDDYDPDTGVMRTDDDEEDSGKKTTKTGPAEDWTLDQGWFKWKPLSRKVTVNNSLRAKLEKGVDLRRGLTVRNEETGKELRVALSGLDKKGNPKKLPAPGEVIYNYGDGNLYWGDPASSGKTYVVEYFLNGQKGDPLTMAGEENEEKEYNLLEAFKSRAENLWTHLLDNPDPEFVRDTLLPVIEDEIQSVREKAEDQKSPSQREQDLKGIPDLTGEFMELEQLLSRREETDDSEEARQTARDFIESDISPKLSRFYALASLLAERAYDMQSEAEKDEDFPEFGGSGARTLDLGTLKYTKKLRQEASQLDADLFDFSKYYTGLILQWIFDSDTYYPSAKPSSSRKRGTKDPRWEGIKRIFDGAGIGIADLQAVALEAFRRALLEFDRDKRDKTEIPDPKKFRIHGNTLIKRRVQNALKRVFDKYQREQTVESVSRSGTKTVTIPADGKEFDLGVPGIRVEDLTVKSKQTGKSEVLFTPANGRLVKPEDEGRKSNRVKISLGGRKDKEAQVSVTVPDTGKKLTMIKNVPWNAELKKKVAEDPNVFYFASSSGVLWLSDTYRGVGLLVEAPGFSTDSNIVGKNQYRVFPTRGTIEFSPLNAGEEVEISYSQTIKSKRQVNPSIKTDEEGEESSLLDLKEDEGADPQSQAEEAISRENVDKLLEVISDILLVDEDPRLGEEERVILSGLLGIGEPDNQRLTIQEIATRDPFNADISDANKINQIKGKRQKAADVLLEILKEKADNDPALRKMVRPMEGILMGKDSGGPLDVDKFLSYLTSAPPELGASFQNVLVGILGKSGLKQDEENILRWMWALPGKLRRDQDSEDKKYEELPSGLGPASNRGERVQEIAIDEFDIEADDQGNISPAATGVVGKVYDRALEKFTKTFNKLYEGRKDYFTQKYPEFVQYYDRQSGKQNLRDELSSIEKEEARTPTPITSPAKEKNKEPLFDQIRSSLGKSVDESMLRSLMEELHSSHVKGGSLGDLIKQRQKDIDSQTSKGATLLEEKTKSARAKIEEIKKAIAETKTQLESIQGELESASKRKNKLRTMALESADEETQNKIKASTKELRVMSEILTAIKSGSVYDLLSPKNLKAIKDPVEREQYEVFSYLRDAEGSDLEDAKDDLVSEIAEKQEALEDLRRKAVALATDDVRKGLRQLKQEAEDIKSRNTKFKELLSNQEAEEQNAVDTLKKQLEPLQKKVEEHLRNHNSNKELTLLRKVKDYLDDRDELQRSDGSYALDNMFEVPKATKSPGYKAPKLAPGEEDTYAPLPRPDVEPSARVEPKSTGIPEVNVAPAPPLPPQKTRNEPDFQPPAKRAPSESQRTLFDELRATAVPADPEESKSAYQKKVENFRTLMNALRTHFSEGKSIRDFKPAFSAEKTLPNQNKVLRTVVEYLRDYAGDLKTGPGTWDLSNLFKPTIVKPVEVLEKKPDLSTDDKAIESLANAQPSLDGDKTAARVLHQTMQLVNKGEPLKKIIKGLGPSRDIAYRLAFFMSLHEDLKNADGQWDWTTLYTGESKFPSLLEYSRSRPIESQMGPLVSRIQQNLQEEAGPEGGIESVSNTEQRVMDMLHKMSELALHDMDLDQMAEQFEKEDERGSRPYSMAYLFQQVRNYLSRLNSTAGLSNSRNDLGLSKLFGPGAPAGSPTEQDEVKPMSKVEKEEVLPTDERTTAFRQMVKSTDMDEKEAGIAHRLVQSLQLRMESGNKVAAELLGVLLRQNPKFTPVVRKILTYIGQNRTVFESGVTGVPDLSSLTDMPFKHPAVETRAPEPEAEGVPSIQEIVKNKVEPVSGDDRTALRKSIFDDFVSEHELDEDQQDLFADALRLLKQKASNNAKDDLQAIDRLVSKTKGSKLEGVFELLNEFFHEKGLVHPGGVPDFRGVVVPSLGDRESYFKPDGSPNLEKVEKEDVSTEMPEPRADVEEHAEDLAEEMGERGRLSPDLQDAVDFLKSDQVAPEEDKPRDTAKERLKRNIWDMMVKDFDFDPEEQQNAADVLRVVQKDGLDKVRTNLKGKGHVEVLLDDLVDYIKEQGLSETDIPEIALPEETDESEAVGLTLEELMEDEPTKGKKPTLLAPTLRKDAEEATIQVTLNAAQKAQDKDTFDTVAVIKGLEGKVAPEDAKNALLQAMDDGMVELLPFSGSLSEEDSKYVPVASDGVPFAKGRVIRMPTPKAAPEPASEKKEPGTRGRLSAELADKDVGLNAHAFILKHVGLTAEENKTLAKEFPSLKSMTYRQAVGALKNSEGVSPETRDALAKYCKGLLSYLRLLQKGKDPLNKPEEMPAADPAKARGEWRNDPATEKQLRKLNELSEALKNLGQEVNVNLTPKSKGEASDTINSLQAELQRSQGQQTPAPAKTAPTPKAPASVPANKERALLHSLMEKALDWSTKHNQTSALVFKHVLKKNNRIDLLPFYEKIIPEVQKALDSIQGDTLDFDLSDL